jgi:hypothetical protein
MIQINPNKPTDYTIMHAQAMVMHAMSYDVLVGGVVFYPSGLPSVFGRKLHITTQASKLELITSFIVIGGQIRKSNKLTDAFLSP